MTIDIEAAPHSPLGEFANAVSRLPLVGDGALNVGSLHGHGDDDDYAMRATVAVGVSLHELDYHAGLMLAETIYLPHAWLISNDAPSFVRPALEAVLRRALSRFPDGDLRMGTAKTSRALLGHPQGPLHRPHHLIVKVDEDKLIDVRVPNGWRARPTTSAAGAPELVITTEMAEGLWAFRYWLQPCERAAQRQYLHAAAVLYRPVVIPDPLAEACTTIGRDATLRPAINRLRLLLKPSVDALRAEAFSPALLATDATLAPASSSVH